jgi:hypothetical protein
MNRISKGNPIDDAIIIEEAKRIVEEGNKQKILLRILGAVAVAIHSANAEHVSEKLQRLGDEKQRFTDVDLMACSKQRYEVRKLLEDELGYIVDASTLALHGKGRLIYYHPNQLFHIDVFFDKLEFSHDVIFCAKSRESRLSLDSPTIPLADIILEKTQIHEINEKDVKDTIVLLLAHRIGREDHAEVINAKYIARVLAGDWGFWYDATNNLDKVKKSSRGYVSSGLLTFEESEDVTKKVDEIMSCIEQEEKSKKWRQREKKGTKKSWWCAVEEISR